jgi:hypothetical protein
MGATKINTKKSNRIMTNEIAIESFRLLKKEICKFAVGANINAGDVVLCKASFKNPCEPDLEDLAEESYSKIMYRRRVVPFLTRVRSVNPDEESGRRFITANIESITPSDKIFFYNKFFANEKEERLALDIEGKHIIFQN